MFDKLDLILQADTDDIVQLAKIADISLEELISILKRTGFDGIDVRNLDLTKLNLEGADFNGIVANAGTIVDPGQKWAEALYRAGERYFRDRLFVDGCCNQYAIDERIHLLSKLRRRGVDDDLLSALHTLFDSEGILEPIDIAEAEYDSYGGFLLRVIKAIFRPTEVDRVFRSRDSGFPTFDYQADVSHLQKAADETIFATNLEIVHDFDLDALRGDIFKFLSDCFVQIRRSSVELKKFKYNRYHFFLRTYPVLSLNPNASFTIDRWGKVTVERIWTSVTPAVYEKTPKGDQLRPSLEHYKGKVLEVPKRLSRLPSDVQSTGTYDYKNFTRTSLIDLPGF